MPRSFHSFASLSNRNNFARILNVAVSSSSLVVVVTCSSNFMTGSKWTSGSVSSGSSSFASFWSSFLETVGSDLVGSVDSGLVDSVLSVVYISKVGYTDKRTGAASAIDFGASFNASFADPNKAAASSVTFWVASEIADVTCSVNGLVSSVMFVFWSQCGDDSREFSIGSID